MTKLNRLTNKRKKGFTLVELLIVIAILALLMSILIPALSKAKAAASSMVCLNNVRRIAMSAQLYIHDHTYFPPHRLNNILPESVSTDIFFKSIPGTFFNGELCSVGKPRWQWFFNAEIGPVIDPGKFVNIPGFTGQFGDGDNPADPPPLNIGTTIASNDYFLCPSFNWEGFDGRDIRNGSYGYNYQYLGYVVENTTGSELSEYFNPPVSDDQIIAGGKTIMIADARGNGALDTSGKTFGHGYKSYKLDPPKLALYSRQFPIVMFGGWDGAGIPVVGNPLVRTPVALTDLQTQHCPAEARHDNKACVSFVDAHAEKMSLTGTKGMGYTSHANEGKNNLWTGRDIDEVAPLLPGQIRRR